jgi:hypothetical protein
MMQAHRFEAMGTEIECLCESHVPEDEAFAQVEDEFRRLEEIFTASTRPASSPGSTRQAGSRSATSCSKW